MSEVTIYHNPRCSKSRQTLALIEERGIEPNIVEYLVSPPSKETLTELLGLLGLSAHQLARPKEDIFKELNLRDADDEALISAMVEHPIIIERPIVVSGGRAVLGRPPENVLELLP